MDRMGMGRHILQCEAISEAAIEPCQWWRQVAMPVIGPGDLVDRPESVPASAQRIENHIIERISGIELVDEGPDGIGGSAEHVILTDGAREIRFGDR